MKAIACSFASLAAAAFAAGDGIRLEDRPYPLPERAHVVRSQLQTLEMVYMDVVPKGAPRGAVLLLHGKNFSGSYFGETAAALRDAGYRVIAPDQIGFGKSSKPAHYHYSFHQLARNTSELLAQLRIRSVHVLGHSMGGMLATRFALMYPESTASLALLNPIGLEDWKALGVPYRPVEDWYQRELQMTPEKIRAYQRESYYGGDWREEYEPWVAQLAAFLESPDYPRMAWNQALAYDMIFTQPVVHEFGRIDAPTLLIIGQRDRTAVGKDAAPPELQERLGDYPALGRRAREAIPDAELVELEGVGHLPHIEDFGRFFSAYRKFLDGQSPRP